MVHGTARRTPGAVQMGTCQAPFRHALLRGIRSRFRLQSRARAVELAVVMSACVPNSTYVGLRTGRMQVCRSPKREPQCGEDTAAARAARQKKKRMIAVPRRRRLGRRTNLSSGRDSRLWHTTIHHKDTINETTNGTIKRITDKGFDFITTLEGTEYFFHQSGCTGTRFDDLREGQAVSFTVGEGPKGPRAENVSVR